MTKLEKIIIAAVCLSVVGVIFLGVVVFQMKSTLTGKTASQNQTGKVSAKSIAENYKGLQDLMKQFSGTVESVSGNQLTVNVKLVDYSKPKNLEKFKNTGKPIQTTSDDFEVLMKKIIVNTNEKTVFEKKALADLKVGDVVSVTADKSPYTSDTITAEKVTYIQPPNTP